MSPQSRSKYEFWKESSLSQKLAHKLPIFQKLAGSDPETSMSIGFFEILGEHGLIDLKEPNMKLMMDLLNVKRQALFATSERNNEITKMGMMMPKAEDIITDFDGDE